MFSYFLVWWYLLKTTRDLRSFNPNQGAVMIDLERTLRKIASNLMFEWNADVHLLFRAVSPYVWGLFRRNLYRFLKIQAENPALYRRRLAEVMTDPRFLNLFRRVEEGYQAYMNPETTLVRCEYPELEGKSVAYFSMEYGIDTLRIYSGGLGILSGDHLRGASDLGMDMIGIGLFYLQGYYEQMVTLSGQMKVSYECIVPPNKPIRDFLPLETVKGKGSAEDLVIEVLVYDHKVRAKVWQAKIGRCRLWLLDSNLKENRVHDRHITRRLYASEKQYEMERRRRFEQELLLGIGGVRALLAAGVEPWVYHLNEGHVAFALLEILRHLMKDEGLSFDEARHRLAACTGFTTHTPVAEGNERFDEHLARGYLTPYLDEFLKPEEREVIFNCARNRDAQFDMTKLSLLLSGIYRNGVSACHGEVCRKMWGYAWGLPDSTSNEVPIGSITNAVHVPYWQKPALRKLIEDVGGLEKILTVADETIWLLHLEFKLKLIEKIRERMAYQLLREGHESQVIHAQTTSLLEVDSFMIGFARRFAGYKRVTLFLEDEERLFQFMETTYRKYGRPVYILYAGKPHPNNYPGYQRIQYIVNLAARLAKRCEERNFKGQIHFIEGYDIDMARYLEAGVDIWLNNPIRPLEASGTSGMKAGMNGVLNVSIPDGWVPEGIEHGKNGWLFGKGSIESATKDRDELYALLENTILPLYFENSGSIAEFPPQWRNQFSVEIKTPFAFSRGWVAMMKESIHSITLKFNTERMLREYIEKMYLPAVRAAHERHLSQQMPG